MQLIFVVIFFKTLHIMACNNAYNAFVAGPKHLIPHYCHMSKVTLSQRLKGKSNSAAMLVTVCIDCLNNGENFYKLIDFLNYIQQAGLCTCCQIHFVGCWCLDQIFHLMFQFPRTNTQYHKIFKEINEHELLKQSKQTLLTLSAY